MQYTPKNKKGIYVSRAGGTSLQSQLLRQEDDKHETCLSYKLAQGLDVFSRGEDRKGQV